MFTDQKQRIWETRDNKHTEKIEFSLHNVIRTLHTVAVSQEMSTFPIIEHPRSEWHETGPKVLKFWIFSAAKLFYNCKFTCKFAWEVM